MRRSEHVPVAFALVAGAVTVVVALVAPVDGTGDVPVEVAVDSSSISVPLRDFRKHSEAWQRQFTFAFPEGMTKADALAFCRSNQTYLECLDPYLDTLDWVEPGAPGTQDGGEPWYEVTLRLGAFEFKDDVDCGEHPCRTGNKHGEPYAVVYYPRPDGPGEVEQRVACVEQSARVGSCGGLLSRRMGGADTHVSFVLELMDADADEYGAGVGVDDVVDVGATATSRVVVTLHGPSRWSADWGANGGCSRVVGACVLDGDLDGSAGEASDEEDAAVTVSVSIDCSRSAPAGGLCRPDGS